MSSAESRVYLVGMNRLSACREFCGLHSWHICTRYRDGVKVLWYYSHLVWLVFEGSIPTYACLHSENIFLTCSYCFFVFLELVRENRDERWDGKMQGL